MKTLYLLSIVLISNILLSCSYNKAENQPAVIKQLHGNWISTDNTSFLNFLDYDPYKSMQIDNTLIKGVGNMIITTPYFADTFQYTYKMVYNNIYNQNKPNVNLFVRNNNYIGIISINIENDIIYVDMNMQILNNAPIPVFNIETNQKPKYIQLSL